MFLPRCARGLGVASEIGSARSSVALAHESICESNETRQLVLDLGYVAAMPPSTKRLDPWEYERVMYRKRSEVERLFRRLKGYRRIFC